MFSPYVGQPNTCLNVVFSKQVNDLCVKPYKRRPLSSLLCFHQYDKMNRLHVFSLDIFTIYVHKPELSMLFRCTCGGITRVLW